MLAKTPKICRVIDKAIDIINNVGWARRAAEQYDENGRLIGVCAGHAIFLASQRVDCCVPDSLKSFEQDNYFHQIDEYVKETHHHEMDGEPYGIVYFNDNIASGKNEIINFLREIESHFVNA